MDSYLVLKILDSQSISIPSTLIYGSVELRSQKSDTDSEIDVLKESASLNRLDFEKYKFSARISTIIKCATDIEAVQAAENRFSEVLDIKSIEFAISNFSTSKIGYTKNLNTGKLQAIYPSEYHPSMSFMVKQGGIQQFDTTNYILSLKSELSERYLRSLHWSRNSKHEKNYQLKILFYWFSIEALLKESETDNISGTIRWFLGFPNGKHFNDISPKKLNVLNNHKRYAFWKKELTKILDNIRIFRNNSVHSGFRSVDFSKKELELYKQVMVYSASRCQAAVQAALINKIKTVREFKEYIAVIFEENSNLINDTHNNIIFTLDQIEHS